MGFFPNHSILKIIITRPLPLSLNAKFPTFSLPLSLMHLSSLQSNLSLLPCLQSSSLIIIVICGISLPRVEMWSHHRIFLDGFGSGLWLVFFLLSSYILYWVFPWWRQGSLYSFSRGLHADRLDFIYTFSGSLCFFRNPLDPSLSLSRWGIWLRNPSQLKFILEMELSEACAPWLFISSLN